MLKNLKFWKKFSRYLLVGFSSLVLFYFFQVQPMALFAQTACEVGATSITSPANGQQFPAGTASTNLSWNQAQGATHYDVSVRNGNQINQRVTGTSISVPLTNGQIYRVAIRPWNLSTGCFASGGLYESTFSVGGNIPASQTCSNQPVLCYGERNDPDDDGSFWIYPDPSNNCRAVCPVGSTGNTGGTNTTNPTCTISASDSIPSYGELVILTGNATAYGGKSISSYSWDLDGNGNYGEDADSQARRSYYQDTTVRLQVIDSLGYSGYCTRFINVSGSSASADDTDNQCRSTACSAPSGCYYTNPQFEFSCNPNARLCGNLICPDYPTPPFYPTPSFPEDFGNLQQTIIGIVNSNSNINTNTNTNSSSSWSDSYSRGGDASIDIDWERL